MKSLLLLSLLSSNVLAWELKYMNDPVEIGMCSAYADPSFHPSDEVRDAMFIAHESLLFLKGEDREKADVAADTTRRQGGFTVDTFVNECMEETVYEGPIDMPIGTSYIPLEVIMLDRNTAEAYEELYAIVEFSASVCHHGEKLVVNQLLTSWRNSRNIDPKSINYNRMRDRVQTYIRYAKSHGLKNVCDSVELVADPYLVIR